MKLDYWGTVDDGKDPQGYPPGCFKWKDEGKVRFNTNYKSKSKCSDTASCLTLGKPTNAKECKEVVTSLNKRKRII